MSWRLVMSWDAESDEFSTELQHPLQVEPPTQKRSSVSLMPAENPPAEDDTKAAEELPRS